MAGMCGMEYHKDVIGEKLYATRNYSHLRHTCEAPGASRANIDWALELRQNRKAIPLRSSASAPNLNESDRLREPLAPEHPEGPYHGERPTVGRYQNVANTGHMLKGLTRKSGGAAHNIDWQLNLRGGLHADEFKQPGWRRHYARGHHSFDLLAERQNDGDEVTPPYRVPDRHTGAISCATIRDDPISFRRWPGCEGTNAGQWRHLLEDRRYGHKARRQIQHETTLREDPTDNRGSRIQDSRSDGCIVEMMGKKRWQDAWHHEPLAQRLPHGDPRLYHLNNRRVLPDRDEVIRAKRIEKCQRHRKEAAETWEPKQEMQR